VCFHASTDLLARQVWWMDINGDGVEGSVTYAFVPSLGLCHGCREDALRNELGARKRKDTMCDNCD
jgi:hypothetical protein